MICISCGKETREPLCDACYSKKNDLFDIPKNISVNMCKVCGHLTDAGATYVISDTLDGVIQKEIKTKNKIRKVHTESKKVGNKIDVEVVVQGRFAERNVGKKETKKIFVSITDKMCQDCVKLRGNYYEAVVQVRGEEREKILKIIMGSMKNKIASVDTLKEGYDVKIIDKKIASSVSQGLQKKYEVKKSFKLAGKKKGKELYRNYYAIR